MSDPSSTTPNGATPATNSLVINMELADWVYHRASNDQGLGLGEIEAKAKITPLDNAKAQAVGLTISPDNFIYDANTGFACAIVQNGDGTYTIVIRGTDFGNGNLADLVTADSPFANPNNQNLDVNDIQQDSSLGAGTFNPQNQVNDALNVIALLQAQQPGATINLVGQSLGGGVAGVAAAITGLPATIIDPAPFASQLKNQALLAAAAVVGATNVASIFFEGGYSATPNRSLPDQDGVIPVITVGDYIATVYGQASYDQFVASYQSTLDKYNSRANINAVSLSGEFLSLYSSLLGLGGANQLPYSDPNPIVLYSANNAPNKASVSGLYEALALHSPTLAALAVATQNMPLSFAALLRGDVLLQNAFFGQTMGNAGAISNPRSDTVAVTSKVNASGADPGILERALLKTVGDPNGFYAYFSKLFSSSLVSGALAAPAGASNNTPSLHSAFEKLTLDVFRDKVANTSTVNDIYALGSTGVSILSAVGGSGGAPLGDAVIIHKSDITATDPSQLASDGLQFGAGDLSQVMWNDLRQAAGSDQLTEELLGLSKDYIFGTPATYDPLSGAEISPATPAHGIPWDVVVASDGVVSANVPGSGAFSFDPNDTSTGARPGDASKNLVIFGGQGTNTISAGSDIDFIVTGDGNSTVTLNTGLDCVICGAGIDTVNAGEGSAFILGGTGSVTLNATAANGASALSYQGEGEEIFGGSGNVTVNANYYNSMVPHAIDIEGGSGTNTINLQNVDAELGPNNVSSTNIWGGQGTTYFNITSGASASFNIDIDLVYVSGLTNQTFSDLNVIALQAYINSTYANLPEDERPLHPVGIDILDQGNTYYYNNLFGVNIDPFPYVVDVSQFQITRPVVDPDAGSGSGGSGSGGSGGSGSGSASPYLLPVSTSNGNDAYLYATGDGNLTIDDANNPAGHSGTNTLVLSDLTASDLTFAQVGNDLQITTIATDQVLTIQDQFIADNENILAKNDEISNIFFSDGSTWDLNDIYASVAGSGSSSSSGSGPSVEIVGTVNVQKTTSEAPIRPFFGTTIIDKNSGATETLTITVSGFNSGLLTDGPGFSGLTKSGIAGPYTNYTLTGTAAAVSSELDALVFKPSAGAPNSTTGSDITLSLVSSAVAGTFIASTSVDNTDPVTVVTPTISGAVANQATTSETPVKPFSGVTTGDVNSGSTETLTITVGGAGGVLTDGTGFSGLKAAGSGVYTLTGTAAAVTSELDALTFKPVAGTPNASSTSTFKLTDTSSAGSSVINSTVSVIDSDPAVAPTIAGTVANQATTSEAPVKLFSGVTVGDANANSTETFYIVVNGSGTLTDGAGYSGLSPTGNPGQFVISGTAAAVTQELRAMVFTPAKGSAGTTATTSVTVGDITSAGPYMLDSTTSVINTDPVAAVAPTISGTVANQATTSETAVKPFSGVKIGDANSGATDTITITVGGAGGVLTDGTGFSGLKAAGSGVYTLTGTATAVTSELDALTFKPVAGTPNASSTSTFKLTDASSAGTSVTNTTANVIDSDPAVAPTIAGTVANQATTSEAPVKLFSGVMVGDANANSTETFYIVVNGSGTLTDGAGYSGLSPTGSPGQYVISGTAAAVTQELRAMVFTPAKGSAGTSATTSVTLGDITTPGTSALDYATSIIDSDPASPFGPDVGTPYAPPAGSDTLSSSGTFPLNASVTGQHTITFQAGVDSNVQVDVSNYGTRSYGDIFKYARADGNVSIRDTSGASDILEFTDLKSTDVTFHAVYSTYETSGQGTSSLAITVTSTGRTITLDDWNRTDAAYGPQSFVFADGVTFTRAQILATEQNQAPAAAQYRFDGAYTTTHLSTERGGAPVADVWFDQNSDTVYASTGVNTYHYASADGSAQILDTTAQQGVLSLSDLTAANVTLSRAGTASSDLLVTVNATGRTIDIANQFANNGIGSIAFADGTTITAAQIAAGLDGTATSYVVHALDAFAQAKVQVTLANGQSISPSAANNYSAIVGSSDAVTVANGADISVIGNSNTISAGNNDVLNVVGAANTVNLSGGADTLVVGGNGQSATNANDDTVNFLNGGSFYEYDNSRVDVSGSGVTANIGTNDTLGGYGSALTVNASGPNDQIYVGLNGQGATSANDDTVNFAGGGYLYEADNSRVDVLGSGVTANIGTNDTLGIYGSALTINASGTNDQIYIGRNGQSATSANDDTVNFTSGGYVSESDNSRLDVVGSNVTALLGANDVFGSYGSNNSITVGAGDAIYLSSAASADRLLFNGNTGATSANSFSPGDIIDLLGGTGGYTSAAAAFSALKSDGQGGSLLSLGANGSIDFINTAANSLSASNFKIG